MKTVSKARVENRNTRACNFQKTSGAGVPGLLGRSVTDFSLFSVHFPREVTLLGLFYEKFLPILILKNNISYYKGYFTNSMALFFL